MKKLWKKYLNLRNFVIFICFALLFILGFNYFFGPEKPTTRNDGLPRKQAEIRLKDTGKTVKLTVELAQTPHELTLGLSNRDVLETGLGMYFVLPVRDYNSFWMKDMRFPLDIIWIDQGTIVGINKNCPIPQDENNVPTFRSPQKVTNVLEVNAGFSDQNNINSGDTINLQ